MTDRQRLGILIVLLVVLGVTLLMAYRMNRPQSVEAVDGTGSQVASDLPAASDARIRLDLLGPPEASEDVGNQNLFQYRSGIAPPPTASSAPPPAASAPPVNTSPPPSRVAGPPPPPPIPLKYEGYAEVNANTGVLRAFLTDANSRYTVMPGEVIMGRYRILQITESMIEVEDLEFNRRQTIPRTQPAR